jgi:hypothetical protein
MSIVESGNPRRIRRFTRLEGLAGGALVAAAVFAATPKLVHAEIDYTGTGGTTTDPNAAGATSWFNTANWNNGTATGTLAESNLAGAAQNIEANNVTMPSVGVVFDPADDTNAAGLGGAAYVANLQNVQGSFYLASEAGTVLSPNKLTVESGTIIVGTATIGRDTAGILAVNGGTFIVAGGTLKVQGANRTTVLGSGTFEYHGGNLETLQGVQLGSGACSVGVSKTSAGVGYFVVYNDGADGAMLSQNGFQFAANTNQKGTIGIVEFHYDANTGGVKGTRPIQSNWNQGNGESGIGILHIQNNTNSSSRLNLVLDTSPGTIVTPSTPGATYQNLGLFDETLIAGSGTFPKAFYSVDGSTVFTQGATISAVYAGSTYSWTISYSGQINFTDTGASAYNSSGISGTGGDDVVLLGITPVSVPEPTSLALLGGAGSLILARRRQKADKAKNA